MKAASPLDHVIPSVRRSFAFLEHTYRYAFAADCEVCDCSTRVATVLRWTNLQRGRAFEVYLVPLHGDYVHEMVAFVRLRDGHHPGYEDNVNFLPMCRVLAYFDVPDRNIPLTRSVVPWREAPLRIRWTLGESTALQVASEGRIWIFLTPDSDSTIERLKDVLPMHFP